MPFKIIFIMLLVKFTTVLIVVLLVVHDTLCGRSAVIKNGETHFYLKLNS